MSVLLCSDIKLEHLRSLLDRYGMSLETVEDDGHIPGSFWQPPEAGLIDDTLYIRNDTPVHSALHEACHYICMDQQRREKLNTDAGGTALEESAWGYSYRLGSAKAWFEQDAEDAFAWLMNNKIISSDNTPTWCVRT